MNRTLAWLAIPLLIVGCNVQDIPDVKKPQPTPDTPVVVTSPAESYWKGLAKRVESGFITSPKEMANVVQQLVISHELTAADVATIEAQFPHMATDAKQFSDAKAAAAKLRAMK